MDGIVRYLYFSSMSPSAAIPAFFLYGEPLHPPDEATVHVETIAARSRLHDWNIAAHRHHDLHQLLILHRGRMELRLDDVKARHAAPAIVLVPAGTVHAFRFAVGTEGWVITFAGDLARALCQPVAGLAEFFDRAVAVPLTRAMLGATDLARLSEMLLREFTRGAPGREVALRGLLAALLGNVLRLGAPVSTSADGAGPRDRELVARFRRAIESRYREHATITEYVRELEVSEARLRRACVRAAGQRPVDLVHQRILVEAERQLRYTSLSISQIAYQLGFNDPAYFTRFFTRRTGSSPSAFRPAGARSSSR